MNLQNIVSDIEQVDPEIYERLNSRRSAMKSFMKLSGKVALAAVPFALGGMLKKSYGQTPADVLDVLQYALQLEYLEADYYNKVVAAVAAGTLTGFTSAGLAAYQKIRQDENAHVSFLQAAITASGGTPAASAQHDFTAGNGSMNGPLSGANSPLTNYAVTLVVGQVFEDTGVRAYKGQAGRLVNNNDVLTAALQIHSVEARHAAHVRQMRYSYGLAVGNANAAIPAGVVLKPWITLNQSAVAAPFDAFVQASYNGEEVVTQAGVNTTSIGGQTYTSGIASEAFDEPLTQAQVLAIVDPFLF